VLSEKRRGTEGVRVGRNVVREREVSPGFDREGYREV